LNLVIVESPAKIKKLESFLGRDFRVVASMGHFRDLPPKGLGVDVDTMDPEYVISKPDVVKRLKNEAKNAKIVYLCTDPDREGEAISWHLQSIFPKGMEFRRATFQEITKKAVLKAIDSYGTVNNDLADAQQARRILDRLVGYKLSPELWKVFKGIKSLSAGRVQSVATRLIVDREKEIQKFKDEVYYKIHAFHVKENITFRSELKKKKDSKKKFELKDEKITTELVEELKKETFIVEKIEKKKQQQKPQPPFTTSNMQAKAAYILKMSPTRSMQVAQKLYEGGHITYHRTDSVAISEEALSNVRQWISGSIGEDYIPKKPNVFSSKANAQEAHECIRPTQIEREPNNLNLDEKKLYELIKNQFISSQMANGVDSLTKVKIIAGEYEFEAKGRIELFDGYRKLNRSEVQEKSNKKKQEESEEKQKLPPMEEGEQLNTTKIESKKLKTKPPARYSESGLIKKLEKEGIGRPSTYASIVTTIQKRGYVSLQKSKYYAEDLGIDVTDFLVAHFPKILALDFTKQCELRLDTIGEGELGYKEFLCKFWVYFKSQLYGPKKHIPSVKKDIVCVKCKKKTVLEESKHWKGRYFYCCHSCQCYLEANQSGKTLNKQWIYAKK
jgi:DNA topoisomerase I